MFCNVFVYVCTFLCVFMHVSVSLCACVCVCVCVCVGGGGGDRVDKLDIAGHKCLRVSTTSLFV